MMLHHNIKKLATAALTAASLLACSPEDGRDTLGPKPVSSFTVQPIAGEVNKYLLTSTSSGEPFIYKWTMGDETKTGKAVDTAYFPEKGKYTISLMVLGDGGYGLSSQEVTVENDDPDGCIGNKRLLTACGSKVWVLEQPGGGALWVGDPGGGQWWANGPGDVTARSCQFDDEWTFNSNGTFSFDNHGDMWIDDEGGAPWPTDIGLPVGCTPMTAVPAKYQAWGSGNFTFKVTANTIKVMGTGAHLGLYKVGENGTTAAPEEFITYNILEMTESKMVVQKMYGWGQWRFTFKAKQP
ncbi:PKD domain-containing protein [Flavihumibacter petaseus]|uniref:PKD domain-containing protein n=1 Tax=Flavihumibacter petaseus NBRC 106054 TaxID=1220578 RepID=A0A0E9MXQ7_9BACT|nr:PKD domain-containing protein [Flavihumibacter petaseus]GAO42221.1 hypothetical protein FPE01S_01_12340 [Flavihumibacter petaseus NBRC 106054]